jgi:glutaminyl-peptide cyclotransferase
MAIDPGDGVEWRSMKPTAANTAHRIPLRRGALLAALAVAALIAGGMVVLSDGGQQERAETTASHLRLEDIREHFDGQRAFEYLQQIGAIGPRYSGSPGMIKQQELLASHFTRLGAQVEYQRFNVPDPRDGRRVPMVNLIVHWLPKKEDRILLCAHYDTLPFPMRDPRDPWGRFIGANDGASGVALLMELGNQMADIRSKYGVDFVFFDAEEYIFDPSDRLFLGSEFFARKYRTARRDYRYRWGVLLDMVGDADLQVYQERNSAWWRDTRPLVADIWATAARLGVREFVPRKKHEVRDDHLPLHDIAGIPTCDIIDYDYPDGEENRFWHTTADTADKCSPLSLAKVGWVVREWLATAR